MGQKTKVFFQGYLVEVYGMGNLEHQHVHGFLSMILIALHLTNHKYQSHQNLKKYSVAGTSRVGKLKLLITSVEKKITSARSEVSSFNL